ncbi:MAG: hypothetical protein J0L72_10610 [Armatimonadetes bacterium]|nr:hypothetical protein [Armatimonadota bacterium]
MPEPSNPPDIGGRFIRWTFLFVGTVMLIFGGIQIHLQQRIAGTLIVLIGLIILASLPLMKKLF